MSFRTALITAIVVSGCAHKPPPSPVSDMDGTNELTTALRESARRASEMRIRLANMQPVSSADLVPANPVAAVAPDMKRKTAARIDIDYIGPAENAAKIISKMIGWEFSVSGKKRTDTIVSLRHSSLDAISILQDLGAQCGSRCDVHVDFVEGAQSSVSLTYRD